MRQVFKVSKGRTVAGCMVMEGNITRNKGARLVRGGEVIAEGKIDTLRRFKDDVTDVKAGFECGMRLDSFDKYEEGDVIETIDKSLKLKVNKLDNSNNHFDIEVGANSNLNIMVRDGALNMNVNGNVNIFSLDDVNISCDNFRVDASNKVTISSGDKMLLNSSGENDINGTPINLN